MILLLTALSLLIAAIHIYTFFLESVLWGEPKTNKVFGVTKSQAEESRLLAFNQGFYNLFLALAIVTGNVFQHTGLEEKGNTLIQYAIFSVLGAGLVLLYSEPKLKKPAMIQILPAAIYLILFFSSR